MAKGQAKWIHGLLLTYTNKNIENATILQADRLTPLCYLEAIQK